MKLKRIHHVGLTHPTGSQLLTVLAGTCELAVDHVEEADGFVERMWGVGNGFVQTLEATGDGIIQRFSRGGMSVGRRRAPHRLDAACGWGRHPDCVRPSVGIRRRARRTRRRPGGRLTFRLAKLETMTVRPRRERSTTGQSAV